MRHRNMDAKIWIVTGSIGSRKTTFCREMVQKAQQCGWDAAGLLSLAEFKDGMKESIWAQDIRSGEKRLLASAQQQTETDLHFGEWYFDQEIFDWGNQVLKSSTPCDLLVIDELGPVELRLSSGWVSALDVIKSKQYRLALVVIRPGLLELAEGIFQPAQIIHLNSVDEVTAKVRQYSPFKSI